ncbi:hypothetical protein [Streptomyces sp. WAC 06738]|uniref:hypothetical protein n=1 Tax=Streptomyces sp. WAC 06738 TaxID=2203210 RepID=UPI000F7AD965|nr:hypothetical protein [Streptomyces sp. WAC 06738]
MLLVFLAKGDPFAQRPVHDLTGARAGGIAAAVTDAGIETTADSGCQGAGGTIRTPVKRPAGKGHNGWEKEASTARATLRAPVERGFVARKRRRVLDRVRISPNGITPLLHALFVIQRKKASVAEA